MRAANEMPRILVEVCVFCSFHLCLIFTRFGIVKVGVWNRKMNVYMMYH